MGEGYVPSLTSQEILRILVASPGDLLQERQIVRQLAEEINHIWAEYFSLRLRLIMWEEDTFPAIGSDAQAVVNAQIGDDYEVFLGMYGERVGQATPRAASGTIEEFERAYKRYRLTRQPQIMFYFRDASAVPHELEEFRRRVGDLGVYYSTFRDTGEFGARVRFGLSRLLQEAVRLRAPPPPTSAAQANIAERASAAFAEATSNMKRVQALTAEMTEEMRAVGRDTHKAYRDLASLRPGFRRPRGGLSGIQSRLAIRFSLNADRIGSRSRLVASAHQAALQSVSQGVYTLLPAPQLRGFLQERLGPISKELEDLATSIELARSRMASYREAMNDHPTDTGDLRAARERVRTIVDWLKRDFDAMAMTSRNVAMSLRREVPS